MTEIAVAKSMDLGQACRIARLKRLATAIIDACLDKQGSDLALEYLIRSDFPACWYAQAQKFEHENKDDDS